MYKACFASGIQHFEFNMNAALPIQHAGIQIQ